MPGMASDASSNGEGPRHEKVTVRLPRALVDRARNAAYWSPSVTVAGLVERGLQLALKEVEPDAPYPAREGRLKNSRPA